ncbi:hypothetical protein BDV93DRAFT_512854 [Ceratobasidium sp. AG-I]|nr:hypothetical protein BDV93DRAFT_512854 [Ceratobasidium sp. AG-I]
MSISEHAIPKPQLGTNNAAFLAVILYSSNNFAENELPRSLSLAPYPHALPNLQTWRNYLNAPYLHFEVISDSPLHRLTIQVPRLECDLLVRLSNCMLNLTVLELDQALTDEEDDADHDVVAAMAGVILSGLNLFPELQTIRRGTASSYKREHGIESPGNFPNGAMETLAEKVPALRSVHTEQAILHMVDCDNSGAFRSTDGINCFDDVDVGATGGARRHGQVKGGRRAVQEPQYAVWIGKIAEEPVRALFVNRATLNIRTDG